jgi:hypothetical protein
MGVLELFFYIVIVVLIGWGAVWLVGYLAPGHPAIIDKLIWLVVIVIVIVTLASAFGLTAVDPRVPRLRG